MKKYYLILVILAFQVGCLSYVSSHFDDVHPVWLEDTLPTADLKAPKGFKITPKDACEIVRKTPGIISLKHVWHIYADSKYYYIHDAFLGSNSSLAKSSGIKIDGQTGMIINRK